MPLFWLSFVDTLRPPGDRFLGVVLADAPDVAVALTDTHAAGCHVEGAEVLVKEVTPSIRDAAPLEVRAGLVAAPRLTVLSVAELRRLRLLPEDDDGHSFHRDHHHDGRHMH